MGRTKPTRRSPARSKEGDFTRVPGTGGTGNVGANVVRQLLEAGANVRVLTRNPDDRSFPGHVEVMPGDLTRPETCRQRCPAPGWIGEQHLQLERAVAASGLPCTYVRPDAFMTNDLDWTHQIINGGVVRAAYGNAATAPADPRDIAAAAVRALLDQRVGEVYALGPQSLTQIDRVRIIAETIGRPLRFEEQPREQFRKQLLLRHGLPAPVIDEFLDQLAARDGNAAQILPTVGEITGRPAFTYAQWVAHRAAEFGSAPA